MSRRLVVLILGSLAIAGAAVITLRSRQRTDAPLSALQQLATAARAKNRAEIERYLNVRRTAESVVDEAFASAPDSADPAMRPMLVSTMELSIWSMLLDSLVVLEGRYQGLAGVEESGGVARVGVRIRSADGDSTFKVRLRMERAAGQWRLVGIEDLGPYMRAGYARRLERAREAERRSNLRNHNPTP
jgi:hypothetical protein